MKYIYTLLVLLAITTIGCRTAYEIMESGDYDRAIDESIKKVRGKKNKKDVYVQVIEEAFAKASEEDLRRAAALRADGDEKNWEEVHDIFERVDRRQRKIEPLLPLYSKNGYKA